ncbi:MAG TPA: hypothetical protein VLW50_16205 [Streptosporangiaceae bacterium]|nr:hypothetical protein [Streptosporangiaceae bacterium]
MNTAVRVIASTSHWCLDPPAFIRSMVARAMDGWAAPEARQPEFFVKAVFPASPAPADGAQER